MPAVQAAETSIAPAPPKVGGRRTQLKVVRERIQSLSKEVGDFRKSHEVSTKKLEADMASLRKDVTNIRSKDLGHHLKGHAAETERLEKQIKALRNELGSMKAKMAKETSRSKAREKALISRIVAKARTAKPSKPRAKQTKRRR
jgi:predicted  nucleic acid-binding Zn-ribbon protein